MIVVLQPNADKMEVAKLVALIESKNLKIQPIEGQDLTILGLVGDTSILDAKILEANDVVRRVLHVEEPYKKANRLFHPNNSEIKIGDQVIGGEKLAIIAGPCSVESREQITEVAKDVKASGANFLRGGAFKPRTSPYAFQGLGYDGLELLKEARKETGLPVVTELMSTNDLEKVIEDVDVIQIGARNMQNFDLLKAVGKMSKPILLKRGLSATIEEWIMSAEYIMASGNPNVIFCERGIRTFEKYTRNTLDLSVIPILKEKTHLPVIIDPSHATGDWKLVESMSLAAIAAGADGLIIEVHNNPECAWSDGMQSLKPEKFKNVIEKAKLVAQSVGRSVYEG